MCQSSSRPCGTWQEGGSTDYKTGGCGGGPDGMCAPGTGPGPAPPGWKGARERLVDNLETFHSPLLKCRCFLGEPGHGDVGAMAFPMSPLLRPGLGAPGRAQVLSPLAAGALPGKLQLGGAGHAAPTPARGAVPPPPPPPSLDLRLILHLSHTPACASTPVRQSSAAGHSAPHTPGCAVLFPNLLGPQGTGSKPIRAPFLPRPLVTGADQAGLINKCGPQGSSA